MKRFNFLLLLLLLLLSFSGCVTVYNPATGREEFYLISTQEEINLGQQVAWQTERRYQVVKDPYLNHRLQSIAQRIVNSSDRKDIPYRFRIIKIPDQINAFAAPGGIIYVTYDLIKLANDDELAVVLGHEVGHVAARHAVKKIQMNMGIALIESLIFQEKKMDRDLKQVQNITKGNDTFLRKLKERAKNKPLSAAIFFHSHPPYNHRIKAVQYEITGLESGGAK